MSSAAVALAVIFLALALVAIGGAARVVIDGSWRPPFRMAVMATVGVGLAVLALHGSAFVPQREPHCRRA